MQQEDINLILYINEAISTVKTREDLYGIIAEKLRKLFVFDVAVIIALDKEMQHTRLFVKDFVAPHISKEAFEKLERQWRPIKGQPGEAWLANPVFHYYPLQEDVLNYPDFAPYQVLTQVGIQYIIKIPLKAQSRTLGFLHLGTMKNIPPKPHEQIVLELIASQLALAMVNITALEEANRREQEKTLQLAIAHTLVTIKDREALFQRIAQEINQVIPCSYLGIRLKNNEGKILDFANLARMSDQTFEWKQVASQNILDEVTALEENQLYYSIPEGIYVDEDFRNLCGQYQICRYIWDKFDIRAQMVIKIWDKPDTVATLVMAENKPFAFTENDYTLLKSLIPQIALAMENLYAFEEIKQLKQKLEQERNYLVEEIKASETAGVIGNSLAIQNTLIQVRQVSTSDATVLITGETGTGKEVIARTIHELSHRRTKSMVKINCAALPPQLIESELFGHEKGSFTGAFEKRIGKFELADGGTIFLDEIGEMPLELQAKLLRVLQERELERIGGKKVIPVDVRILAATNRNLKTEIEAGRFRSDLYYRLNVFPIWVPPLRERKEDIPLFIQQFNSFFSQRIGKPIRQVREEDLTMLIQYEWPGNIRELEHVIEHAIILSTGPFLDFSRIRQAVITHTTTPSENKVPKPMPLFKPLREMERDYILSVLEYTKGRVSGKNGAAVILDINPFTLEARLRKLGIQKEVKVSTRNPS